MKTDRNLPKPPRRRIRGVWNVPSTCPGCAREHTLTERPMPSAQLIRGEEIHCDVKKWVCAQCGAAFMSPAQATDGVRVAVSTYQRKHGLLTADEIRAGRRKFDLSVSELAQAADLGEATVKRLEAGTTVQRASTNRLLLTILSEERELPHCSFTLDCPDVADLCLPVRCPWNDEEPWNNPSPWSTLVIGTCFEPADSNELALAV